MPNPFKDRLKAMEQTYKDTKADQEKKFEKHPLGKFWFLIVGATITESKNKDNPKLQVQWNLRNVKGKHINKTHMFWDGIETPVGLAILKGRLEIINGKAPRKLIDLPEALDQACDKKVLVEITPAKGDFLNTTILKRSKKKASDGDDSDSEAGL